MRNCFCAKSVHTKWRTPVELYPHHTPYPPGPFSPNHAPNGKLCCLAQPTHLKGILPKVIQPLLFWPSFHGGQCHGCFAGCISCIFEQKSFSSTQFPSHASLVPMHAIFSLDLVLRPNWGFPSLSYLPTKILDPSLTRLVKSNWANILQEISVGTKERRQTITTRNFVKCLWIRAAWLEVMNWSWTQACCARERCSPVPGVTGPKMKRAPSELSLVLFSLTFWTFPCLVKLISLVGRKNHEREHVIFSAFG